MSNYTAPKKLAIDGSSFMWRALKAGKDTENGFEVTLEDGKVKYVNSADYGYENVTSMLCGLLSSLAFNPKDVILVFEGKNSKSKRLLIDKTYKSKSDTQKVVEEYIEFNKLKDMLSKTWRDLGAMQLIQDYAEGDDTLAWLAQEYPGELVVATYDGDLTVLNTEEGATNAYGGTCKVWIDGKVGMNKYGAFEFKYVRVYKALCGDSSDGVKGCAGFGPAAFDKLVGFIGWDGIDELCDLLEARNLGDLHTMALEPTPLGKLIKKIVESEDSVFKAWDVVKVRPEWVNTFKAPLQWIAGKVAPLTEGVDKRLAKWYGQSWLITAANYSDAMDSLRSEIGRGRKVAFDIETSSADESDDWLAMQGNPDGVDVIGSSLTGFSLTYGANDQYTIYVSVNHAETDNVTMVQAREMLELVFSFCKPIVIHNTFFELPVLFGAQDEDGTYWKDLWKDNGYYGFIPNVLDTKLESSYQNENMSLGLKNRSLHYLGYEQTSYDTTTKLTGVKGEMLLGGRLLKEWEEDGVVMQERRYKMNELPATDVFDYGVNDTVCTASLHNFYELFLHAEHSWQAYLDTEINAAYLHAKSFVDGVCFSLEKSKELEKIDDKTYADAWAVVRAYLIKKGWEGTTPPVFTPEITVPEIKLAWSIVTGQLDTDDEDEDDEGEAKVTLVKDFVMAHRGRTPSKLLALIASVEGHEVFADKLARCMSGDAEGFTSWVQSHFTGEPVFKIGNKQMTHLLYSVMGCPVQIRGKPTPTMKAKGQRLGNPKADSLAVTYAIRDMASDAEIVSVLESLKLMQMTKTRRGLYYGPYPYFVHWKTARIHPSHNQSATTTRRASMSRPNTQQLPKSSKIEGQAARYRETIVPHRSDAVIVSMDFSAQELRQLAQLSQDSNLMACYVGDTDSLRDMHALTGLGILQQKDKTQDWTYEKFVEVLSDPANANNKLVKKYRGIGKTCNFAAAYNAMADRLSQTMMCSVEDAQIALDANAKAFPEVEKWKKQVVEDTKKFGYVLSMCGARRHLRDSLVLGDNYEKSKSERQGINYMIQGSSAEQTKRAEGSMWATGIFEKFDAIYYGPCHDESVASVRIQDLHEFLPLMHACMVQPFPGMTDVPIESSVSFGRNYYEQIELNNYPTAEAIQKGIEALQKQ